MRQLADETSTGAKAELDLLADRQTSIQNYRHAFYNLGTMLAKRLDRERLGKKILLVCTSEDADHLARGVLDGLIANDLVASSSIALACFWQARFNAATEANGRHGFDVAPIFKRYEEPTARDVDSLVIVKSIIASSCVVRHALLDVIGRKQPKDVYIVAPVILRGAPARLRREFPQNIARRFHFTYFAEDNERDASGHVLPGIGGSVYERLGLSPRTLGFTPELVLERRRRLSEERLSST